MNGTERRELVHVAGGPGEQRAEQEDRDGDDEQNAAAKDIAELAVERSRNGRHDEVCGGHPGLQGHSVQVVGNGAHRRRDHGLIESREEHASHEADHDQQNLTLAHDGRGGGGSGGSFIRG